MQKDNTYSDKELLEAVRDRGASGWDLFHSRFDPMIRSIAGWPKWRFSEDEKQDVCQNIHMQLQTALSTFRQQSSLSWFIKRIAVRQCINEIRRQVRWRSRITPSIQKTSEGDWNEMEFENPNMLDPLHEVLQSERRQTLRSALQKLQDTCRNSITLFYVQELSYREMSNQLGISVNTVGSRLSKCLDKLHKDLRQHPLFERTRS
jgi:RNA polymerase sigma-70 factor (ECF subfamily)